MNQGYWAQEARIDEAMAYLSTNPDASIASIAREYDVLPGKLQRRCVGGCSKSSRPAAGKALTDEMEEAICEYIHQLDSFDMSARPIMIRKAANYLLAEAGIDRVVRDHWTKRFLTRHPEFVKRKQKPLAAARKNAHNLKDILHYFRKFHEICEQLGIEHWDVWNMDETGFRIGCGKAQWVVTAHRVKQLLMTDPDIRSYITSVECISAGGFAIPAMIILQGRHILNKWVHNNIDENTTLAVSDSGYSNDYLAYEWLVHFERHSRGTQRGVYRLLIMDGYGSHLTYKFWDFARTNRIVLFRLPAHTTHLTQPLDVGLFQPFKHYHQESIDKVIRLGNSDFDKLEFLACFQGMRERTFTDHNIISAFRKTGLFPFDPEQVLTKIRAAHTRLDRDLTPEREILSLFAQTPHGSSEVLAHGIALQKEMDSTCLEDLEEPIRQAIKGGNALAHSFKLVAKQLKNMQDFAIARRARKSLPGTIAQKGEVITIHDVRAQEKVVYQDDVSKAEVALIKAQKAAKRQANDHSKALIKAWQPFRSIVMIDKKNHIKWEARMRRLHVNRMLGKNK